MIPQPIFHSPRRGVEYKAISLLLIILRFPAFPRSILRAGKAAAVLAAYWRMMATLPAFDIPEVVVTR